MKKTFTLSLLIVLFVLSAGAEGNDTHLDILSAGSGAANDTFIVIEDQMLDMNVTWNDVPFDSLLLIVSPHFATLQANESGFEYSPDPDYFQVVATSPVDSFQYALKFADDTYDSAWVFVDSILGVNDTPVAVDDYFMVMQDSGLIYATILANDIDKDKAGLQVQILPGTGVKHGKVKFSANAFKYGTDYLFFPNDGVTPFNKNLLKPFEQRDSCCLVDTVFVYEPNADFYGYDTMHYIIREYRPTEINLFHHNYYTYVWREDADTAMLVFYVEPYDYVPVAVNDTLCEVDAKAMKESDIRKEQSFSLLSNDLDADTLPAIPSDLLSIPFIIAHPDESALATTDDDTVLFIHQIPSYDMASHTLVFHADTNRAVLRNDSIYYSYAAGYCGVDSLFYSVVEQSLVGSDYPNRLRGDTSDLGIVYFVVEPVNDAPHPMRDTLDFNFRQAELVDGHYRQYFDILANDFETDVIDNVTLSALERLMGSRFDQEISNYGSLSVKNNTVTGLLQTTFAPHPGKVRLLNDSIYYDFIPDYNNEVLIDSFQYLIYNGEVSDTSGWAYIRHEVIKANDDVVPVSFSSLIINKEDSTLASNLLLTANDVRGDTLFILYKDKLLDTPSKSAYAEIKKSVSGEADYYYHQGFTDKDSFQYVVSDLLVKDTAWVFISNEPCVAKSDRLVVQENPFASSSSYFEVIDVLDNDNDAEEMKSIMPFATDTLDTGKGLVVIQETEDGVQLNYFFKKDFFYKDSFVYVMTDVPAFYAANNFFTQDSAWVYVVDSSFVIDSDADGIVNTMEDGVEGFQLGEDTLDFDGDSLPNYLDVDADGDGFRDAGDCDGDGVLNFLDPTPGCDDIEVATAFTPNGDGVNDFFVIPEIELGGGAVMPASIKIYNRWGSLVYENESYGQSGDWWDGNLGKVQGLSVGNELPNGVYLYYLIYNNGKNKKDGFVHIQR